MSKTQPPDGYPAGSAQKHGGYSSELIARLETGVAVYRAIDDGRDFVFVDVNPAAERMGQIKREQILGRRLTEVFPGVEKFGLLDMLRRVWRSGR